MRSINGPDTGQISNFWGHVVPTVPAMLNKIPKAYMVGKYQFVERSVHLRVGIVDDHPAIIVGTTTIINMQPDMRVVASGSSVAELFGWGAQLDVVLLDLSLSDGSSITSNVQALTARVPAVLAYTATTSRVLIREAARAGVDGAVLKTEEADRLCDTIRAAARGEATIALDWADAVSSDSDFVNAKLTRREQEVLTLYALGETAERVATTLFISVQTVHDHVRRIRAKYAAVDRPAPTKVDLHRRAVEDGLVESLG